MQRTLIAAMAGTWLALTAGCGSASLGGGGSTAGQGAGSGSGTDPGSNPTPTPTPDPGGGTGGTAIVADHRAVQAFSSIPAGWLAAAKALTVHYAHTSHGSQIVTGLEWLEQQSGTYSVAVRESGTEGLPAAEDPAALRIYDGNPPDTYITPDLYWDGSAGLAATRAVAATGRYDLSMWAWCGQQSSNDTATVNRYLAALSGLQAGYSPMRFVLFTGHTDGSNTPAAPGTLKYNNALVRDHGQASGMAVYDFADIESWDPGGTEHPTTSDACDWCADWCTAHPADCAGLDSMGDCAHTHKLNCVLKAKAYWWLMARLAGWDGK
jgi:hypothetical protein